MLYGGLRQSGFQRPRAHVKVFSHRPGRFDALEPTELVFRSQRAECDAGLGVFQQYDGARPSLPGATEWPVKHGMFFRPHDR